MSAEEMIIHYTIIIIFIVGIVICHYREKRHKNRQQIAKQKFRKATQDFIAFMRKEYTEDNNPNNMAWLFLNLSKAIPEEYENVNMSSIFANEWRDEKRYRGILDE